MTASDRRVSHLVVIGASAGGIESLGTLVSTLPASFPAAIVVAQHISPHRSSALADILARRTPLPVRALADRETLEAGVIYVVPPHRNVVIDGDEVLLREDGDGAQPSIDLLFHTAAQFYRDTLIAVVLSGTGSDGASGAREVKYGGGTVIIENPDTAAYPGMPLSLAPSVVDITADIDRIGELLDELVRGEYMVPPVTEQSQLRTFLGDIRDQTGIDFTSYKQPTVLRRLKRRMMATGQDSLADYVRFVHQHPDERQRLVASFLIKVTGFFRDADLFTHLRDHILPELLADARQRDEELRIWSAGCSTGEEAYSLAMVVDEARGDELPAVPIRVFATDLDESAVAFARRGIYPPQSLAGLPPGMHERYFTTYGDDFEVARDLRTMLVFGEHDLGQRAPFPRIDLILCRNVLIYFTPALQRRALQMFAFSLRSGGYLALGKSETISPLAEYFAVDQPRLKVYRRVGERALIPPTRIRGDLPSATGAMRRNSTPVSSRAARGGREPNRPSLWHGDHILLALPVGVVVVDRNYDIHFLNSEARRLLDIHAVALDQDLIHLIHHYDPMQFRRAIDQALDTGQPSIALVSSMGPSLEGPRVLEIACSLVARSDDGGDAVIALVITEVTEREHLRRRIEIAAETQSRLAKSNDEVLAANEELTHTIAMLRSENEDLHVAAEEIQAATEEVETLNEELQASNEELETLNEEMQATVEELNTTNDDLQSRSVELHALAIEAELARKQLRMILDGVDAAVVVYNDAGGIELHNTAWDDLGIGDGLAGQMLDEVGHPLPDNDLPSARASLGDRFAMTIGLRCPDDGVRWYRVAGEPMSSDAFGRLVVVTIQENAGPR